ncbi:MAG: DUF3857 domain-containing protein [Terracidiphilus sp.]|jgi:hypothetical protein
MPTNAFLRSTLLLFVLAAPILLRAQFQQPTDDELKMTADPKAPGAAAVYLYREETIDDALHSHSYYERIKVLTEKGREQATIHIPFERGSFKVTEIKGRTIHADGTVIPLTVKPADLMDVKNEGAQTRTIVFTLPSVEVGSILEYRLKLTYDENLVSSPTWEIQQPLFVHKAHYFFNPTMAGSKEWLPSRLTSSGNRYSSTTRESRMQWYGLKNERGENLDQLMYAVTAVPAEKVVHGNKGDYSLDLADIAPIPNDDWMPPIDTLRSRVQFYYTYAHSGVEFWDTEQQQWAKDTDQFTNPTALLKTAVTQIVSPADTDEQKARKIYAAVMKLNNTDFNRKKTDVAPAAEKQEAIRNAEEVWKQQSGSANEVALLYSALARAAGLKVWPMQVADRDRANFDVRFMSIDQLNDYVAIVELGSKEVFLDPGQKMCPFGSLHWRHSLASGFRLSDKGAIFGTTPSNTYRDAGLQRIGELDIHADGKVEGTIRFVMTGPEALRWRQAALENDLREVKVKFDSWLESMIPESVKAHLDHFLALDNPDINLMAVVNIQGSLDTAASKQILIPASLFDAHSHASFVDREQRFEPVDMHYCEQITDRLVYHLPPGFAAEPAPQDTKLSWPEHAVLVTRTESAPGQITVARSFARAFTVTKPEEYPALHDFYQKVAAADHQQLVLTATSTQNGN